MGRRASDTASGEGWQGWKEMPRGDAVTASRCILWAPAASPWRQRLQQSQVVRRCNPARLGLQLRDTGTPSGTSRDPWLCEKEVILDLPLNSQHPRRLGDLKGSPTCLVLESGRWHPCFRDMPFYIHSWALIIENSSVGPSQEIEEVEEFHCVSAEPLRVKETAQRLLSSR